MESNKGPLPWGHIGCGVVLGLGLTPFLGPLGPVVGAAIAGLTAPEGPKTIHFQIEDVNESKPTQDKHRNGR